MWLGSSVSVVLIISTLISGRIADICYNGVKNSFLVLIITCTISYLWLILVAVGSVSISTGKLK